MYTNRDSNDMKWEFKKTNNLGEEEVACEAERSFSFHLQTQFNTLYPFLVLV